MSIEVMLGLYISMYLHTRLTLQMHFNGVISPITLSFDVVAILVVIDVCYCLLSQHTRHLSINLTSDNCKKTLS